MKRVTLALILVVVFSLSGCSIIEGILPTQVTLTPVVSSPFPPGIVETLARATLTAKAQQALFAPPTATPPPPAATTPEPSQTPPPTLEPTPTRAFPTTPSGKPFAVQAVGPLYTANFANPALGCAWQGVGGQVLRQDGEAIPGIVVVINGQLGSTKLDLVSLTGNQAAYGPGGYEVVLSNNPITTTKTVFIQLFDKQGAALSEPYSFNTYATCSKNLAIINFQQVR